MRYMIDDYYAHYGQRGMGGYTKMLIKAFSSSRTNVLEGMRPIKINFIFWQQLIVPFKILLRNPDCVIHPYNSLPLLKLSKNKEVLVLHDLIFMENYTQEFNVRQFIGRWYRRMLLNVSLRRADLVLTVSEATKVLLLKYCNEHEISIKVEVLKNIIAAEFVSPISKNYQKNYILCVSGSAPHKNLNILINAFLNDDELFTKYDLYIVGCKRIKYLNNFSEKYRDALTSNKIKFFSGITTIELVKLYDDAAVFVFPSLAEGFGIPVLEALLRQKKIACSDLDVFHEIAGQDAIYFDPRSQASQVSAIKTVINSNQTYCRLKYLKEYNIDRRTDELERIFNIRFQNEN